MTEQVRGPSPSPSVSCSKPINLPHTFLCGRALQYETMFPTDAIARTPLLLWHGILILYRPAVRQHVLAKHQHQDRLLRRPSRLVCGRRERTHFAGTKPPCPIISLAPCSHSLRIMSIVSLPVARVSWHVTSASNATDVFWSFQRIRSESHTFRGRL